MTHKNLSKKSIEALSFSGALDTMSERNEIMLNMDEILKFIKTSREDANTLQESLFGDSEIASLKLSLIPAEQKTTMDEKLTWEKELLGIFVSGSPLDKFRDRAQSVARYGGGAALCRQTCGSRRS